MRTMLLIALAATPVTAADHPARADGRAGCANPAIEHVAQGPSRGVHPLTHEPPAKQVLTVMRSVDGCTRPVVVREEVGTPAAKPPRRM